MFGLTLVVGLVKGRKDAYAPLQPFVVEDRLLYIHDDSTESFQSVRFLGFEKFEIGQVEQLLQDVAGTDKLVWHKQMGQELGIPYLAYKTTVLAGDNVIVDPNAFGPVGTKKGVEITHTLRWWEVVWVRISHPGDDPFN